MNRASFSLAVLSTLPVVLALVPACKAPPAPGPMCQSFTPSSTESDIAAAVGASADGECFTFAAGTYTFDNQLALGTGDDVTLTGAGIGVTLFDFKSQVAGDDAIFGQSVKGLTLKGFTVKDAPGNGVKMLGVDGVTFDTVEVTWTLGTPAADGPYGLYPVQC